MWGALAGMVGGGLIKGIGSMIAGNNQAKAYENAIGKTNQIYDQTQQQNRSDWSPYLNVGKTATGKINDALTSGTGFAKPFNMADFYSDPGYQFTLQQGQNAVNNSAAAKGGLLSGGAAKGLAGYTAGLANQTFGDAYNRYLQTRDQDYSQLMGVAGMGENATGQLTGQNTQIGGAKAGTTFQGLTGAADARAAGTMGLANGLGGAAGSVGGYYGAKDIAKVNPLAQYYSQQGRY